jgi:FkbM family methyltransferase
VGYKRAVIRLLDRPGGRSLLGKIATHLMRRRVNRDFEVAYMNGLWTRRVGSDYFPDGQRFDYTYPDWDSWEGQANAHISQTADFWFTYYQPKKGDVIVDVGAGRGEDTLTFSRAVGETGRVIAIEAHPLSFAILKNFCQLNGLHNVTALHLALMDQSGAVRIIESASAWVENAVDYGDGPSNVKVQAATLDDICKEQGLSDIDFLKMNIEGAERFALLGMSSTFPRVRDICVACHDFRWEWGHGEHFRTRAFVERFLVDQGFEITSRWDDPRTYVRDHVYGLRSGAHNSKK